MMRIAALTLLVGSIAIAQSAINVSGKWAIQVPARGGGAAAAPSGRGVPAGAPAAAARGARAGTAGPGAGGGGGGRGGQVLTLNQVGPTLTGELVGGGGGGGGSAAPINNEIFDGKVDGATVSFYIWRGTDKPYKVSYSGTVNAAGDEIAFTVTGAPARGVGAGGAATAGQTPPTIARRVQ